jgi:hypothetical protein
VGKAEVSRRGGVGDGVDTLDRLIKSAFLRDILDNDEFKAVTVVGEFVLEESALRQ